MGCLDVALFVISSVRPHAYQAACRISNVEHGILNLEVAAYFVLLNSSFNIQHSPWASSALAATRTTLHSHVLDGGRCWPRPRCLVSSRHPAARSRSSPRRVDGRMTASRDDSYHCSAVCQPATGSASREGPVRRLCSAACIPTVCTFQPAPGSKMALISTALRARLKISSPTTRPTRSWG